MKQVLYDHNTNDNLKKTTKKHKQSTNMDNKLKSVPQRKLLRDDRKALLRFILNRLVWQSDRRMQGEMKEKHPCESE